MKNMWKQSSLQDYKSFYHLDLIGYTKIINSTNFCSSLDVMVCYGSGHGHGPKDQKDLEDRGRKEPIEGSCITPQGATDKKKISLNITTNQIIDDRLSVYNLSNSKELSTQIDSKEHLKKKEFYAFSERDGKDSYNLQLKDNLNPPDSRIILYSLNLKKFKKIDITFRNQNKKNKFKAAGQKFDQHHHIKNPVAPQLITSQKLRAKEVGFYSLDSSDVFRVKTKKKNFSGSCPLKGANEGLLNHQNENKDKFVLKQKIKKKVNSTEIPYFNHCFDKGRVKSLIIWYVKVFGENTAVELVEKLKELGFYYATHAGISIGIDDLKIPPKKFSLIALAEKSLHSLNMEFSKGNLTSIERLQTIIDTWHRTSESIKQNVINYFKSTNVLNPIYMMAFSGARGNISQVRQLVGMRGLMADPQGQILDFPIQSNFREGLTLTEYIISCYGARKGVVDTALHTAKAGYLTRRLVDVAQHVVVSKLDCGTELGFLLKDLKSSSNPNKTLVNLEQRLTGRVLAETIYLPTKTAYSSLKKFGGEETRSLKFQDHQLLPQEGKKTIQDLVRPRQTIKSNDITRENNRLLDALSFLVKKHKGPASGQVHGRDQDQLTPQIRNKSLIHSSNINSGFILAEKNKEISEQLAKQISKYKRKVLIRSPLSCQAKHAVCQLCYGWSLSQKNVVALGEAVGVIAAQSIGEPGTQLTMRTFHTGGVFSADVLDQIYSPVSGKVIFPYSLQGSLIRTPDGKIAFFTQHKTFLEIVSGIQEEKLQPKLLQNHTDNIENKSWYNLKKINLKNIKISKIYIPRYTTVLVRQGEIVSKNKLIGATSFKNHDDSETEGDQSIETYRTVYSPMGGEVYFENLPMKKKTITKIILNTSIRQYVVKKISGLGSIWILSGRQIFLGKTDSYCISTNRSDLSETAQYTERNFSSLKQLNSNNSFSYAGDLLDSNSLLYQSFLLNTNKLSVWSGPKDLEGPRRKNENLSSLGTTRALCFSRKNKEKDCLDKNIKIALSDKTQSGLNLGSGFIRQTEQKLNLIFQEKQRNSRLFFPFSKIQYKNTNYFISSDANFCFSRLEKFNASYNKIKNDIFGLLHNPSIDSNTWSWFFLGTIPSVGLQSLDLPTKGVYNLLDSSLHSHGPKDQELLDQHEKNKKIKNKILNWFPKFYKTQGGIYFFKKSFYSILRTNTKLTSLMWNFILFNNQKQYLAIKKSQSFDTNKIFIKPLLTEPFSDFFNNNPNLKESIFEEKDRFLIFSNKKDSYLLGHRTREELGICNARDKTRVLDYGCPSGATEDQEETIEKISPTNLIIRKINFLASNLTRQWEPKPAINFSSCSSWKIDQKLINFTSNLNCQLFPPSWLCFSNKNKEESYYAKKSTWSYNFGPRNFFGRMIFFKSNRPRPPFEDRVGLNLLYGPLKKDQPDNDTVNYDLPNSLLRNPKRGPLFPSTYKKEFPKQNVMIGPNRDSDLDLDVYQDFFIKPQIFSPSGQVIDPSVEKSSGRILAPFRGHDQEKENKNKPPNFILEQKQITQIFSIKQKFYKTETFYKQFNPINKISLKFTKTFFNSKYLQLKDQLRYSNKNTLNVKFNLQYFDIIDQVPLLPRSMPMPFLSTTDQQRTIPSNKNVSKILSVIDSSAYRFKESNIGEIESPDVSKIISFRALKALKERISDKRELDINFNKNKKTTFVFIKKLFKKWNLFSLRSKQNNNNNASVVSYSFLINKNNYLPSSLNRVKKNDVSLRLANSQKHKHEMAYQPNNSFLVLNKGGNSLRPDYSSDVFLGKTKKKNFSWSCPLKGANIGPLTNFNLIYCGSKQKLKNFFIYNRQGIGQSLYSSFEGLIRKQCIFKIYGHGMVVVPWNQQSSDPRRGPKTKKQVGSLSPPDYNQHYPLNLKRKNKKAHKKNDFSVPVNQDTIFKIKTNNIQQIITVTPGWIYFSNLTPSHSPYLKMDLFSFGGLNELEPDSDSKNFSIENEKPKNALIFNSCFSDKVNSGPLLVRSRSTFRPTILGSKDPSLWNKVSKIHSIDSLIENTKPLLVYNPFCSLHDQYKIILDIFPLSVCSQQHKNFLLRTFTISIVTNSFKKFNFINKINKNLAYYNSLSPTDYKSCKQLLGLLYKRFLKYFIIENSFRLENTTNMLKTKRFGWYGIVLQTKKNQEVLAPGPLLGDKGDRRPTQSWLIGKNKIKNQTFDWLNTNNSQTVLNLNTRYRPSFCQTNFMFLSKKIEEQPRCSNKKLKKELLSFLSTNMMGLKSFSCPKGNKSRYGRSIVRPTPLKNYIDLERTNKSGAFSFASWSHKPTKQSIFDMFKKMNRFYFNIKPTSSKKQKKNISSSGYGPKDQQGPQNSFSIKPILTKSVYAPLVKDLSSCPTGVKTYSFFNKKPKSTSSLIIKRINKTNGMSYSRYLLLNQSNQHLDKVEIKQKNKLFINRFGKSPKKDKNVANYSVDNNNYFFNRQSSFIVRSRSFRPTNEGQHSWKKLVFNFTIKSHILEQKLRKNYQSNIFQFSLNRKLGNQEGWKDSDLNKLFTSAYVQDSSPILKLKHKKPQKLFNSLLSNCNNDLMELTGRNGWAESVFCLKNFIKQKLKNSFRNLVLYKKNSFSKSTNRPNLILTSLYYKKLFSFKEDNNDGKSLCAIQTKKYHFFNYNANFVGHYFYSDFNTLHIFNRNINYTRRKTKSFKTVNKNNKFLLYFPPGIQTFSLLVFRTIQQCWPRRTKFWFTGPPKKNSFDSKIDMKSKIPHYFYFDEFFKKTKKSYKNGFGNFLLPLPLRGKEGIRSRSTFRPTIPYQQNQFEISGCMVPCWSNNYGPSNGGASNKYYSNTKLKTKIIKFELEKLKPYKKRIKKNLSKKIKNNINFSKKCKVFADGLSQQYEHISYLFKNKIRFFIFNPSNHIVKNINQSNFPFSLNLITEFSAGPVNFLTIARSTKFTLEPSRMIQSRLMVRPTNIGINKKLPLRSVNSPQQIHTNKVLSSIHSNNSYHNLKNPAFINPTDLGPLLVLRINQFKGFEKSKQNIIETDYHTKTSSVIITNSTYLMQFSVYIIICGPTKQNIRDTFIPNQQTKFWSKGPSKLLTNFAGLAREKYAFFYRKQKNIFIQDFLVQGTMEIIKFYHNPFLTNIYPKTHYPFSKRSFCGTKPIFSTPVSLLLLTPFDQITFATNNTNPIVKIGQFLRYGDFLTKNLGIYKSGQVLNIEKTKVTLRLAKPVLVSSGGIIQKINGDFVNKNFPLLTLSYKTLKTGDIVQGIPKIEELLEARQTKDGQPIPGNMQDQLYSLFMKFCQSANCTNQQAARQSLEQIQQRVVDRLQLVYQSQGISIADKHFEIIVRQITSKVRILIGGKTKLLTGELIDLYWIESVNKHINGSKATYEPVVLAMTRAALQSNSFISSASFQETTRVLTRAAIQRKTDFLRGLKENVILGYLIPAGTGHHVFNKQFIKKEHDEKTNTRKKQKPSQRSTSPKEKEVVSSQESQREAKINKLFVPRVASKKEKEGVSRQENQQPASKKESQDGASRQEKA